MRIKLVVLLVFLSFTACSRQEEDSRTIRIAYLPITHSAAVMLMGQVIDDDAPYTIELVRFTTWPDVVDALRVGRVDGASILFEVAMQASLQIAEIDSSFDMISLSHRDGNVLVVDNYITSYRDLIGRTVAIPHRLSPQHTLLQMVLEREGIDPGVLNIIEISPAEMPFTLASGAIAAYIVAEPFGSISEAAGVGRIFETSNQINPNSVCCVMVFRNMDNEPELREWLIDKFNYALKKAQSEEGYILEVFRQHSTTSDDVIRQAFSNITFDNLELSYEEYLAITYDILRHGVMTRVPDFCDFVFTTD
ncbi:MAG: ABC transporter substrate-binding protein [Defluviitaleaceae bacterium]|nr:ABC transporter substrate-binding protein [Defluviitaleaceae bacterium]